MFKQIIGDWKYLTMLVVTVAGVVVPIWLSQPDIARKSISASVLSQVALQPVDNEFAQEIQVIIGGKSLKNPYLSVIQLSNDGEESIASSDFEVPLEIHLISKTQIARVRVAEKLPADIEAEISWGKQTISLKPLLLNAKDKLTLSVLTSGEQPQFSTRARIAGISSVPLIDATLSFPDPRKKWGLLVVAFLFFVAWNVLTPIGLFSSGNYATRLRKRAALLISILAISGGSLSVYSFLEMLGEDSFWHYMLFCLALIIVTIPFALKLNQTPEVVKE